MNRWFFPALLLYFASRAVLADEAPASPDKQKTENLEQISEYNRAIWRYRRCVYRYEEGHGASKDGKPPAVCGEEPKLPK